MQVDPNASSVGPPMLAKMYITVIFTLPVYLPLKMLQYWPTQLALRVRQGLLSIRNVVSRT
jgi:hypothetical protein